MSFNSLDLDVYIFVDGKGFPIHQCDNETLVDISGRLASCYCDVDDWCPEKEHIEELYCEIYRRRIAPLSAIYSLRKRIIDNYDVWFGRYNSKKIFNEYYDKLHKMSEMNDYSNFPNFEPYHGGLTTDIPQYQPLPETHIERVELGSTQHFDYFADWQPLNVEEYHRHSEFLAEIHNQSFRGEEIYLNVYNYHIPAGFTSIDGEQTTEDKIIVVNICLPNNSNNIGLPRIDELYERIKLDIYNYIYLTNNFRINISWVDNRLTVTDNTNALNTLFESIIEL